MKRMLSGIKPTGELTLGNYLGALKHFVDYQDEYEMFVFVANLHCITVPQNPIELRKYLRDAVALYLACGLDPAKATIFLQSDISSQCQLGWIVNCHTYLGELNRMTQFKDKQAKGETNLTGGIYTYPALMAADILAYDADYVPVGEDQKQHVELARDVAERMNNKYGDCFKVPAPLIAKVGARIMSLSDPTKKMSKSEESNKGCIYLLEDLSKARKKIMGAVTDSENKIYYDPINKPGISNLLQIESSITGESIESLVNKYDGLGYGQFKRGVADAVVGLLENIQARYNDIINSDLIEKTLAEGALKARAIADKKLIDIEKKIGIEIRD